MAGLRHNLSSALKLFSGAAVYARYQNNQFGIEWNPLYKQSFGAPAAIVNDALVNAATSTELPNNATITYTTATDGTSPLDGTGKPTVASVVMADGAAYSVWPLDVPRNLSLIAAHGSSLVAMTLLVSGFDQYGEAMSELFTITATGTSKTATGKKAFKWIKSYAFTSAGNATTNTAGVQWGNTLGLPFRFLEAADFIPVGNGVVDTSAVVTVAVDTAATTTTGDVRGTVLYSVATDGTKKYGGILNVPDRSTKAGAFGVSQA